MPVGLALAAAPTIKSKSVAISTSYPKLSTLRFPPNAAGAAGYLPNERRLISASAPLIIDDQPGVHASTTSIQHMSINHRVDIAVAEEFLDSANVTAVFQKMGCKRPSTFI
jgi:hypothetical protein